MNNKTKNDESSADHMIGVDDFRGLKYFEGVVNVPSLNVRYYKTLDSAVPKVLHEGDEVIVNIPDFNNDNLSECIWGHLSAINGVEINYKDPSSRESVWFIKLEYLGEFRQRPYLSPDPTAVG